MTICNTIHFTSELELFLYYGVTKKENKSQEELNIDFYENILYKTPGMKEKLISI